MRTEGDEAQRKDDMSSMLFDMEIKEWGTVIEEIGRLGWSRGQGHQKIEVQNGRLGGNDHLRDY